DGEKTSMKRLLVASACLLSVACTHDAPPPPPQFRPPPPAPAAPLIDPITARRALARQAIEQMDFDTLMKAIGADPLIAPFLQLRLVDVEVNRGNFANAASIAAQIIA